MSDYAIECADVDLVDDREFFAPVSSARLRELLHYDPITGLFYWRQARSNRPAGAVAGTISDGYIQIQVDGRLTRAHRLAWLYMTGKWPAEHIDHWDGDGTNNRFKNLRPASQQLNNENIRKARRRKHALPLGVVKNRKRWSAAITVNRKRVHLGTFDSPELAHAAYVTAKRKLHAGCTL